MEEAKTVKTNFILKLDHSTSEDWSQSVDRSKTTDDSVTHDSSFTNDSSWTLDNSKRTDNSTTVDDSNNLYEGNNYRGVLQGALEKDSLAVKDWNNAVNEYREAELFLSFTKSGLKFSISEQEHLTTKKIALTTALTNDMNQIRKASDSNAEFDSQTDSARVYAKAEVGVKMPGILPFSASAATGTEGSKTWQDGNRQESSVNYDTTYQDVAGMLQEARSAGNAEMNAYDSIKDYYGDIIELAPSDTEQANATDESQDSVTKDEPYNNRGGRHRGW